MNPKSISTNCEVVDPGMRVPCQKFFTPTKSPICFSYNVAAIAAPTIVRPSSNIQCLESCRGFRSHVPFAGASHSKGEDDALIDDLSQSCDDDMRKRPL